MSRTTHAHVDAADRAERRARRTPRKPVRRSGTRAAVITIAVAEFDVEDAA